MIVPLVSIPARQPVADIERGLDCLGAAKDHRRWVDEAKNESSFSQRISTVTANHLGNQLLLLEIGHDTGEIELSLGNANRFKFVAGSRQAKEGKRKLIHVVIVVQSGLAERVVELLEIRRHHLIAQFHRCIRILHCPVIDHHQLLHFMGNRCTGVT